jgi:hypothetical protein
VTIGGAVEPCGDASGRLIAFAAEPLDTFPGAVDGGGERPIRPALDGQLQGDFTGHAKYS